MLYFVKTKYSKNELSFAPIRDSQTSPGEAVILFLDRILLIYFKRALLA